MEICRVCMKTEEVLVPMYGDQMIQEMNLPLKLAELTAIEINKYDGLPNKLCAKCAYRTNSFYDFKLQVLESDKKLHEMLQDSKDEKMNTEKEEIVTNVNDEICNNLPFLECIENKSNNKNEDIAGFLENTEPMDPQNIDDTNFINFSHMKDEESEGLLNTFESFPSSKNNECDNLSDLLNSTDLDNYTVVYVNTPENPNHNTPENPNHNIPENSNHSTPENPNQDNTIFPTFEEPLNTSSTNQISDLDREEIEVHQVERKSPIDTENNLSDSSDSIEDNTDHVLGSFNDTVVKIKEIRSTDGTTYQCTLCHQNFQELVAILMHTVDNHIPSGGPYFCVVCEKDCDSYKELRSHVKTHVGESPYICFICNKAYSNKRYLKRHMVCHSDFLRHRCPKCGQRFAFKADLESHISATHENGAPYSCNQCSRVFKYKVYYKKHLMTHLDPSGLQLPKFPCNICGKRFLNNRILSAHIRIHTGEKPFNCKVCGKAFSQEGNLLNHMKIHLNPRNYTCEVCGKRFNQRATLRDHSLLHTGEKPYVCSVCGLAFTFSTALRRHMWLHADNKPYGCDQCKSRFVAKYDLKRHMKIHTDKPKQRKRKSESKQESVNEGELDNGILIMQYVPDAETVLIEQVLLNQDVTQTVTLEESEKENVDALFNLIQCS